MYDVAKLTRAELRKIIYDYVMESSQRLEVFTDLEICTEYDHDECVTELSILLDDMDTNDMRTIVNNINHEDDFDTYYDIFYN